MSTKKSKSKLSGGRRQQERGEETSAVKGEAAHQAGTGMDALGPARPLAREKGPHCLSAENRIGKNGRGWGLGIEWEKSDPPHLSSHTRLCTCYSASAPLESIQISHQTPTKETISLSGHE